MDTVESRFFYTGCVVLCLFIIGYIIILTLMYWHKNPEVSLSVATIPCESRNSFEFLDSKSKGFESISNEINNQSIVTDTYLGTRGDMGNQIFQLACVIAAANRSKAKVVLPTRISLLPIIELFDLTQFEWKDVNPDATFYEYDNYERIVIPSDGRTYNISGYRQAYKYFEDSAANIRNIFTPRIEILNAVREILPTEYIAVHIRKGDYIKYIHKIPLLREFRRCQLEYYKQGIRKLRESYPDCNLLVCTDSPQWVTPLLAELDSKAILAPVPNDVNPKFSDFCTLYLANGLVMSNSTYSWWASYLRNNRPIVAPSPWWDPDGFIGTAMALDGPYLHHPDWWILHSDTGEILRAPHSTIGEKSDNNHETLMLYRLIRGMLL